MRVLSAAELLNIWERGLSHKPAQRALALLGGVWPEVGAETLASLSIGRRDGYLLNLREWLFGSQIASVTRCPACADQLELTFDIADVRVAASAPDETLSVRVDDHEVYFRLPNSRDLLATAGYAETGTIRQTLIERCLVEARRRGQPIAADDLPGAVVDAMAARMDEADPQAHIQFALACPGCGHEWQATFDIVSFLWGELTAWAERALYDVHVLASAYGWREADILNMSPWRRQFYLEVVRQ